MTRRVTLLALAVLVGCGAREASPSVAEPAGWHVAPEIESGEVQVGADFILTLTLRHPPEGDFVPPPEADFAPFTVLDLTEEELSPVESRLVYRLGAYLLPGELELPPLAIRYRSESGETGVLETEPLEVRVVTSLTPGVDDIHDIKEPVALLVPRDLSWLWIPLAALAAAVLRRFLRRFFRRTTEPLPVVSAPPPPAYEEALSALDRLAEKKLLERGQLETFHAELAEIVKRYAGRRFEVHYLERTTGEILRDLRATALDEGDRTDLRDVLDACDLVKFARLVPGPDEARRTLGTARLFIEHTRPPAPLPAESLEKTA